MDKKEEEDSQRALTLHFLPHTHLMEMDREEQTLFPFSPAFFFFLTKTGTGRPQTFSWGLGDGRRTQASDIFPLLLSPPKEKGDSPPLPFSAGKEGISNQQHKHGRHASPSPPGGGALFQLRGHGVRKTTLRKGTLLSRSK